MRREKACAQQAAEQTERKVIRKLLKPAGPSLDAVCGISVKMAVPFTWYW